MRTTLVVSLSSPHTPALDPETPGACLCGLPMTATSNWRHQPCVQILRQLVDVRSLAAGDALREAA